MKKWTFAKSEDCPVDFLPTIHSLDSLYRNSLQSKEGKKEILTVALNAALENLMSWERVAKAWGFDVEVFTDVGIGRPRPVFDGGTVTFVQAYGVRVIDADKQEGGAE